MLFVEKSQKRCQEPFLDSQIDFLSSLWNKSQSKKAARSKSALMRSMLGSLSLGDTP